MKDLAKKIFASNRFWIGVAFVAVLFHTRLAVVPLGDGTHAVVHRWTGDVVGSPL
jgi:hypothetical protein